MTNFTPERKFIASSATQWGFNPEAKSHQWLLDTIEAITNQRDAPVGDETPKDAAGFNGWKMLDNYKIRCIVGEHFNEGPGKIGREHLEKAISLLEKFDNVIVLDKHEKFSGIDKMFGWDRGIPNPLHTGSPLHSVLERIPDVHNALMKLNKYDVELFEYFLQKKKSKEGQV